MVYGYNTTVKRLETQSQWNEHVFTNILNLNYWANVNIGFT